MAGLGACALSLRFYPVFILGCKNKRFYLDLMRSNLVSKSLGVPRRFGLSLGRMGGGRKKIGVKKMFLILPIPPHIPHVGVTDLGMEPIRGSPPPDVARRRPPGAEGVGPMGERNSQPSNHTGGPPQGAVGRERTGLTTYPTRFILP